jgi:high affinity Mn2+ porin
MARLGDAIAAYQATGTIPDLTTLRRPGNRWGGSLNIEQEASANLGFFLRAGVEDGTKETYEFTDIDRTLALGASLKGAGWRRAQDTIGLAAMINGISRLRQTYLADGGVGVLIGDGALPHPGAEKIVEAYYLYQATKGFSATIDAQFIPNPAYNRDRGPIGVLGLRLHGAF